MSLAEALNQARLPIIDYKTCRQKKFWGDRVRDSMICAGFRDTEGTPAACQVRKEVQWWNSWRCSIFSCPNTLSLGLSLTGWLRWPSAMPGRAWPLGGSWHCELWSHWMHGGKQAQRLHSHCSLHPMDRGHAHQGFLLALNSHLQKFPAYNCRHRKSHWSNRFSAMSLSGSGPWTC